MINLSLKIMQIGHKETWGNTHIQNKWIWVNAKTEYILSIWHIWYAIYENKDHNKLYLKITKEVMYDTEIVKQV